MLKKNSSALPGGTLNKFRILISTNYDQLMMMMINGDDDADEDGA